MPQTSNDPEFKEALSKIEKVLEGRPVVEQRRILEGAMKLEEEERAEKKRRLSAMEALKAWLDEDHPTRLERNDCSRLHAFKEAAVAGKVIAYPNETIAAPGSFGDKDHTFVVKHDWAAAFEHAEGMEDGFRLPYDDCCFEFRIAGKTIILFCTQPPNSDGAFKVFEFLESKGYWYSPPAEVRADELTKYLISQIRAICIALDAEVATHTVVRAPHKLNEKRTRAGKVPLADYHVVDLSRRHRVANPSGAATGSKKRLHFRRGHWRHYETNKTWVKWCLVGDPDLGFIQKQYTL